MLLMQSVPESSRSLPSAFPYSKFAARVTDPRGRLGWRQLGPEPTPVCLVPALPGCPAPSPLSHLPLPALHRAFLSQTDDPFLSPPWDGPLHFSLASSPGQTLGFSLAVLLRFPGLAPRVPALIHPFKEIWISLDKLPGLWMLIQSARLGERGSLPERSQRPAWVKQPPFFFLNQSHLPRTSAPEGQNLDLL